VELEDPVILSKPPVTEEDKKRLENYMSQMYNPKSLDKNELERKLQILATDLANKEETPLETPQQGIWSSKPCSFSLETTESVATETPPTAETSDIHSLYLSSIPISNTTSQPDIR
jgi:hypothetical protein